MASLGWYWQKQAPLAPPAGTGVFQVDRAGLLCVQLALQAAHPSQSP